MYDLCNFCNIDKTILSIKDIFN